MFSFFKKQSKTKRASPKARKQVRNKASNATAENTTAAADAPRLRKRDISFAALKTTERLQKAGYNAYLVGGCVRDALLGQQPKDFDVATNATPEQVCDVFNNTNNRNGHGHGRQARIIGRRFKIVHVRFGREIVEVTTFRGDHTSQNSPHSAQDESGMLLRDNVYGSMEDDARRRDFTVNALYCDPSQNYAVIDFVGGLDDIADRRLRLIGDPATRYAEDPVRMLRAVRFACKLDMHMDAETEAAIAPNADRLADIPSARLFDEVLKLLQTGHGLATFRTLQHQGLFQYLFPESAACLASEAEAGETAGLTLIETALTNTDERLRLEKPVTPAFLFGALMWPAVRHQWTQIEAQGTAHIPALQQAARQVVFAQTQVVAMPKRFRYPMQDIWGLQPRLLRRGSRRCLQLLELQRFRAAYDFMLLRIEAEEVEAEHGDWWTEVQTIPADQQSDWFFAKRAGQPFEAKNKAPNKPAAEDTPSSNHSDDPPAKRRRRRRKPRTAQPE